MPRGFVSLVGAGPGDPGLLTLAGRDRLAHAEVVVYDRLANAELLAFAPATAELVFAGKSPERQALTQDEINRLLVERGLAGKRVVRLKGGDPFVFGRGGEEALALAQSGVPFEVVPGVSSAIAAPACAGVPVTHRGLASSFAVVTGHEDDDKEEASVDWRRLASAVDTLVVLMGAAALPGLTKALIEAGRDPDTPAVSVQWGTTNEQRSVAAPLSRIADAVREASLGSPMVTVIGRVADLRQHLAWFERRPLFGKRVLVTRTRRQASELSRLLRERGAITVELPALELAPRASEADLERLVLDLTTGRYAWCLFTSVNAVETLLDYVWRSGRDARVFAACRIAALGAGTEQRLREHGLRADLVASEFSSAGLLQALEPIPLDGARVLLPRAEGGSPELSQGLRGAGAILDEVELYRSLPPAHPDEGALERVRRGEIEVVTFASSSAVRNLASLLGPDFARLRDAVVACIGPVTAATAREFGLEVHVEPARHTIPALVDALSEHFGGGN